MANGLHPGSVRLCAATGRALFAAAGGCRGVVLWAVLEAGGRPGVPVRLNCAELSRLTGLHQPHLNRAKLDMVNAGVLLEHPEGRYEPVADATLYTPLALPGQGRMVDYCAHGSKDDGEYCPQKPTGRLDRKPSNQIDRKPSRWVDRKPSNSTGRLDRKPSNGGGGQNSQIDRKPSSQTAQIDRKPSNRAHASEEEPEREFSHAPPSSSAQAAGGGGIPSDGEPRTLEELVARVEADFSLPVANYVRANGPDIVATLGDRFDCYLAALRVAARRPDDPKDPHSWCMSVARRFVRDGKPPEAVSLKPLAPAPRGVSPPGEDESKGCPHCSGAGLTTVYHPRPDPALRVPASTSADCVCPRGRAMRAARGEVTNRGIPDLADVLAGGSTWLADPPELDSAPRRPFRPGDVAKIGAMPAPSGNGRPPGKGARPRSP